MHNFRNSILKLALFSIVPFLAICYAVFLTGEKTDDFYKRFTSHPQNSLILGSSRASAIDPGILDIFAEAHYPNVKFYNYSFTWGHSPFGPVYLESIKKKLIPDTKNGIFIISVEPSALMVDRAKPDSPEYYFENDKSVATTHFVNINPNIEYLVKSYDYSITRSLNLKLMPPKDPMAEIQILDNGKMDTRMIKNYSAKQRVEVMARKMAEFKEKLDGLKWSENRLKYLEETISFLQKHGKVILVRVPISKVPYEIENNALPFFDLKMEKLSKKFHIPYTNYNLIKNDYQYLDEVHLDRQSMFRFSHELGKKLNEKELSQ